MKNKEIFIHIGYPKTASTTFKKYLFSNHKEFYYLRNNEDSNDLLNNLFYSRENSFKRFMNNYKDELLKKVKSTNLTKFVLSEESLTSFSMFFRLWPAPYIWTIEPNSVARKIKIAFKDSSVFDKVKILIVIRKQDDIIKSIYAQVYNLVFKKFKETRTFGKFLDYALGKNRNNFLVDALYYEDIINEYEKLFGRENICIQVFEELQQDREKYIKKLCDFLGINFQDTLELLEDKHMNKKSSKVKYSSDNRSLFEIINYYKIKYFGPKSFGMEDNRMVNFLKGQYISGGKLSGIKITPPYQETIKGLFAESNIRLSKKYDLDLEKYGYNFE